MFDSWFNSPKTSVTEVTRTPEEQARVDAATATLALYQYDSCMFCARVRRAIAALKLDIEIRDVMMNRDHYRDLMTFGGSTTVPCLRIGKDDDPARSEWMYESADIVAYLERRFGAGATG
ncbi:MAG: glutaredoxin [Gammaproteobacteria bacterium]|nr:glutaredoxin [Gammaproteobacteria bacterium]MCP5202050.1 glutaredoxin [Gammaproteobacteria bacterium]